MSAPARPLRRERDPPPGLTGLQATQRLSDEGPNELPRAPQRTLRHILAEAARDPMFQLLVAGVLVYLLIGDSAEAALLTVFVAVTIGLSVVQQQRTARVLESLRELASPRALVVRDGQPRRVPGRTVVRGDVLVLSAGDRVAADAQLLSCEDLRLDESLITGESVPVTKRADGPGDDRSQVLAGTLVVAGQGLAQVVATGERSSLGRIGRALAQTVTPPTPLTRQTQKLVRLCALAAAVVSLGLVLAFVLRGDDPLAAWLAGITLAMSLLPEEFSLVLTVFMAMGAWRLSAQRVLSRRPAAIEALGAATVLCSDKTGTLTMNRMAVVALHTLDEGRTEFAGGAAPQRPLAPSELDLLRTALLASPATSADPMERALQALGRHTIEDDAHPADWDLVHAWGVAPGMPAMTHVWRAPGPSPLTVAVKGAPETIIELCQLHGITAARWGAQAQAMAERGLRVIGVARGGMPPPEDWPAAPQGLPLTMLGLIGLADPLRPGVAEAVKACQTAGIRVAMVTGDHPATARAIAQEAGLPLQAGVLRGTDLDTMDDDQLAQQAARVSVFARVLPTHKLRLVRALQSQGQVVAMTGDGVNDAPALKAAHIGIAMGARGTDVARESAALVLLDDDFGAIVQGLRLGRRILDNVRKAMAFVLAVHVPIAGLSLLPLLTGGPPLLAPVHIAFLELLIDPVCAIVFEAEGEEPDVMRRPPRAPQAPLISPRVVTAALMQGSLALAAAAGVHAAAVALQWPQALTRTAVFCTLVLSVLALILANRSLHVPVWALRAGANPALWWALGLCLLLLSLVMWVPTVGRLFGFVELEPQGLALSAAAAVTLLLTLELMARRHR